MVDPGALVTSWVVLVPLILNEPVLWVPVESFSTEHECQAKRQSMQEWFPKAICEFTVNCHVYNARCQ